MPIFHRFHIVLKQECKRSFIYLKMNKQLSEGLWRICCNVDSLQHIESSGWDALLGL